ncbi:MAG: hypothetical protein ABI478_01695, partial [Propionivibrio sp.]
TTARDEVSLPLWKDPDLVALARELIKYAVIAAIVAFLLFKVVIPLSRRMLEAPPRTAASRTLGGNVDIVDEEAAPQPAAATAAATLERQLGQARDLAQQDPKIVANVIREWTGSNAS